MLPRRWYGFVNLSQINLVLVYSLQWVKISRNFVSWVLLTCVQIMWWYRPDWRKPTDCWIWGSALHPLTTTRDTHSDVLWAFPPTFAMNFFKTKPRTPPDLVRGLRDAINRLESGAPGGETRRKVRMISWALSAGLLSFWVERFLLGNGRRF